MRAKKGAMRFEQSLDLLWTDGRRASCSGYFDGAGDLNDLLLKLFAGHDYSTDRQPFGADVMGNIRYGTRCRMTVVLETLEPENEQFENQSEYASSGYLRCYNPEVNKAIRVIVLDVLKELLADA